MNLPRALRIQAAANRLANHRIAQALATLPAEGFTAPRVGLIPSLAATRTHGRGGGQ